MAAPVSTVWKLDSHTRIKHRILVGYLDAWYPIMARGGFPSLVVLDGFAGPGRYADGSEGSPLLMLRALVDRPDFGLMADTRFTFVFAEEDASRAAHLERELAAFWADRRGVPDNVSVQSRCRAFADTAAWMLRSYTTGRRPREPVLAFVDPFGVRGLPMGLLAELLSHRRCELIVNFMAQTAVRFSGTPHMEAVLTELFGTDAHLVVPVGDAVERAWLLRSLYAHQLREAAGFSHVQSFGMRDGDDRRLYDLVFATRHERGLERMKQAMWNADPGGTFEFSDRTAGMVSLFIGEHLSVEPLRRALAEEYAGRSATIEEVLSFTTVCTPYLPSHARKSALPAMERDGWVRVARPGSRGYPKGTRLYFVPRVSSR